MKRKKIFLMAYARKNLGDDLFIQTLLEKYTTTDFYMKINSLEYLENFLRYQNMHILSGFDTDAELEKCEVNDYDGYVYAGRFYFYGRWKSI